MLASNRFAQVLRQAEVLELFNEAGVHVAIIGLDNQHFCLHF